MLGKSTHLQVIPQQSTQNDQLAVTDLREKPVDFFNDTARAAALAFAISLATWVPLRKFPFLYDL